MRFPLLATSLLLFSAAARAATISVTTTADTIADDGKTSLREALQSANNAATPTTIAFQIPASDSGYDGSVWTIRPTTALPSLTAPGITIDGYTQPGARANTRPIGSDAVWKIQLQGPESGGDFNGLTLSGGNAVVRGLKITRFIGSSSPSGQVCILVTSANNVVEGCFMATMFAGGDNNAGISVLGASAKDNVIGGTTPQARNVLSNSYVGLAIGNGASGNRVQGNYIGTDVSGLGGAGNNYGILMLSPGANLIGGDSVGARNVIAGNKRGIEIFFGSGNRVQGNFIGTDATGTRALGNTEYGVHFDNRTDTPANNLLGGAAAGEGNVISGNRDGVFLEGSQNSVYGNKIGVLLDGAPLGNTGAGVRLRGTENIIGGVESGQGNRIAFNGGGGIVTPSSSIPDGNLLRGNSIDNNVGLGIDKGADGVTPNKAGVAPFYTDALTNFPVLESATISPGEITVSGTLSSSKANSIDPNRTFALDFYLNDAADESGYGEGKTCIGSTTVATNAQGNAPFSFQSRGSFAGRFVTATSSTSPVGAPLHIGGTSEFCQAIAVQDQSPPRINIKRPADTGIYSNVPIANGLLMDDGAGVQSVKVLLYRFAASGVEAGYWNGSEWTPKLSRANYLLAAIEGATWSFRMPTSAQGFVETRYGLRAYAFDGAGNSGLSRVSRFLIDRTAPTVRITTPQSGAAAATLTQAQGTASDEGGAGVARVTVVLYRYPTSASPRAFFDGTQFVAQESPLIYRRATLRDEGTWTIALPSPAQGFTAGRYSLRADVVDRAGNIGRSYLTDFVLE